MFELQNAGQDEESESDAVLQHVRKDSSVDCASEFAFNTDNNAHNCDSDTDVPLAMECAKDKRSEDGRDNYATRGFEFSIEPTTEDNFFSERRNDNEGDEGDCTIESGHEV